MVISWSSISSSGASPSTIAPSASSGWNGTPILRTRTMSSGASSPFAISAPIGTPPRGSASTTGSPPRHEASRAASWRPASRRSLNIIGPGVRAHGRGLHVANLELVQRQAEGSERFLDIVGEQRRADQVVGIAPVGHRAGLADRVVPFLGGVVATADPDQGQELVALVDIEGVDGVTQ